MLHCQQSPLLTMWYLCYGWGRRILLIIECQKYFQTFETSTKNIYKLVLIKSCNNYIKYRTIYDLYSKQLVVNISYLLTANQMLFNIFPALNVPYLQNIYKLFLTFVIFAQNKRLCMIKIVHNNLQIFFACETLNNCCNT